MLKKMDIKVKIALVYSVILVAMGVGIILFLSIALQSSMKRQPVTDNIQNMGYKVVTKSESLANETYTVTITEQSSMKRQPVTGNTENVSSIVVTKPNNSADAAYTTTVSDVASDRAASQGTATGVATDKKVTIVVSGDELNRDLSSEIFKRLLRYSVAAVIILSVITYFLGYHVSKWLLKPLTSMAEITHQITAENLDLRLDIPESQDEIAGISSSFNKTMDVLQNAFLELERFNAFASHELKNALAVMKTRLEVDYRDTDCKETVGFAIKQVNRITKSINDILAISATNKKDCNELVDIAMAAAEVVDEYQAANRKIILEIPEDGVLPVRGKEIWFQRVIANLVDNAIKHSDSESPIIIQIKQDNEAVTVAVSDSGKGIPGNNRERIWEPYFSTSTDWERGYGLGLAMVNHIVDICGGKVWVDSKEGQGSTFYISLPVGK